jgi:hypothetical protein
MQFGPYIGWKLVYLLLIEDFSERAMKREGRDKTNVLVGVLRGDAFECKCTVALVTHLTPKSPSVAVWTSIRITAAEQTPPDGSYRLVVHGRTFKINRAGGKWPILNL